jgi:hypothetical protein
MTKIVIEDGDTRGIVLDGGRPKWDGTFFVIPPTPVTKADVVRSKPETNKPKPVLLEGE